jgi:hypothetical protein
MEDEIQSIIFNLNLFFLWWKVETFRPGLVITFTDYNSAQLLPLLPVICLHLSFKTKKNKVFANKSKQMSK